MRVRRLRVVEKKTTTRSTFAAYLSLYMNLYTCILVFTSLNTHTRAVQSAHVPLHTYFHLAYAPMYLYSIEMHTVHTYIHTYNCRVKN